MGNSVGLVGRGAEDCRNREVEQAQVHGELRAMMNDVVQTINAIGGVAGAGENDAAVVAEPEVIEQPIFGYVPQAGDRAGG